MRESGASRRQTEVLAITAGLTATAGPTGFALKDGLEEILFGLPIVLAGLRMLVLRASLWQHA